METLRSRHFIPLKYITDILTAKDNGAASHMYRADTVLLLLTSDGRAISLGSGRYASVVLGADRANYEQANTTFLAIKFLKRDVDSDVASKIARTRLYEEIEKTRKITTRIIDLDSGFVAYKGFSSYKSLTSEQYDTEAAETLKSTFGEEMIRSIVRENETRKDEIEKAVAFTLQGEFYVMQAESGTLDDILIYRQPWEARGLEGVRKSLASEGSSDLLGRFRIERHDALMELVRDLKLEAFAKKGQDFSGFAILKEIEMQRPKERNRMVVELFRKITHSIQTVHRAKLHEQEGFLAHRDIKPGNFLVRCGFPELKLLISDLGFVMVLMRRTWVQKLCKSVCENRECLQKNCV